MVQVRTMGIFWEMRLKLNKGIEFIIHVGGNIEILIGEALQALNSDSHQKLLWPQFSTKYGVHFN